MLPVKLAHGSARQVAAAVQDFSCQLGRIEDLVQELDRLRMSCPALSSVTAQNRRVCLVFLGLEAEVKFSVQIDVGELPYSDCFSSKACSNVVGIKREAAPNNKCLVVSYPVRSPCPESSYFCVAGEQYPYGQLQCQARVHLQGMTKLTAAELEEAVSKVAADHGRLTSVCHTLSLLTKPASADKAEKTEKELHVFCNPLFGST